ncbi:hypothetical protein K450DRAFT_248095 [Umbelopsis ramanniana AG]|uniref:SigF-like NTF2-like domain-containing protein n=1 Tax=Umbelopsis ramanniana AG TaxID=1314678 RepID=A0AAD5E8H7_UMBRA|nr:uncharacterized protein K450DRAFT_248095 [Umbelopsis ramanniana AG]KAI8578285.1 hypothetical protein K450DRAFT_248095 [Umbelopsis ramanniana AG]
MDADQDLLQHNQHHLLHKILSDLLSADEVAQRRVLDKYYLPNAKLTSPLISVEGIENIKSIFKLRSTLSVKPPTITTKIFDYWTCAVHLTNYIKIPFIPLVLSIPSWMILHFQETDLDSRLLKVCWHEDSWTIEGILQSLPIVSTLYSGIIRATIGRLFSGTGRLLQSASGGAISHSYDVRQRISHRPRGGLFRTILIRWSDFLERGKLYIPRPIDHPRYNRRHRKNQLLLLHCDQTLKL